jgi:cyanate permease
LLTISIGWFPTYYHETFGMSLDRAGLLMGILSFSGTLSLIVMSVLVIWVSRRRPLLIWPGIATGIAGFGSIFLAGTPLIFVAVAVLGFACWFYLPPLLTIPMELPESDASSVAIIFAVLQSLGSLVTFIAPFAVGYTTDLFGSYLPSLVFFSATGFSLVIAGWLLPETGTSVKRHYK